MEINENIIKELVEKVIKNLQNENISKQTNITNINQEKVSEKFSEKISGIAINTGKSVHGNYGVFENIKDAIENASEAFKQFQKISLQSRRDLIQKLRNELTNYAKDFAESAVLETGLGRVDDKIQKNMLVITKTPGTEELNPRVFTGDYGLTLIEYAPYGVIGSIAPVTNPSETIINNGLGMMAAGNAVVFNAHSGAKKISAKTIQIINKVIFNHCGIENLLTCISEPTIASANELMKDPKINLLVVTGGPQVVKAAMNSGKKVIAAGPGNPPVVVDETADIIRAGRDIVKGASFDNNIVCILEKELFVVDSVAGRLKEEMIKNGAYEIKGPHIERLEKLLVDGNHPNKNFVGKDASKILQEIGISVPSDIRLIIAETHNLHPFVQLEMLTPILPLVRVKDFDEALEKAVLAEHGNRHTAVIHSKNIDHLHIMAKTMNTSIFVKNAPSLAGLAAEGEGYTSFTIASPTGEGLTTSRNFSRVRQCTLKDYFRIV